MQRRHSVLYMYGSLDMSIPRFLLLILCLQTGAALELTVPPTHKAIMGSAVEIPCSFKVNKPPVIRKDLQIVWRFQGKDILSVQNTAVTKSDPRLSYVDRAMEGSAGLTITNVTLSDGGMYTCWVRYSSDTKEKEVRLDIQATPQMRITDKVVLTNKPSVLRSSITGFYPEDIDIKWYRDGETLNTVTVGKLLRHPDGTYSVNSSVTITPTKEDRERIFSCRIQHQSLNGPLQEAFKLVYGAAPSISITPKVFEMNVQQTLVCHVSGFYPESIAVSWLLNGTLVENTKTQNISSSSVESLYQFLPTDENWGMELSCMVEHGTLIQPLTERLLVEGRDLRAKHKPIVIIAAVLLTGALGCVIIATLLISYRKKRLPKMRNIMCSTDGTFSVNVDHFYPKDITICWTVIQPPQAARVLESAPPIMQENQDGTFNATSSCESVRDKVNVDKPYTVRAEVTHGKLKHPIQKEWKSQESNIKQFLSRPVMGDIEAPDLLLEKTAKLQCTISRYYPDSLTVRWYKKGRGNTAMIPIPDSKANRSPARRSQPQSDKTFTYTASLLLTPSLEDQGAEYICSVEHPSLEQPLERSTGPLQVQVKPKLPQPVQLSISEAGELVGSLTLESFYPKDIRVTWSCGHTKKMPSAETFSDNPDGTFTVTTTCIIPATGTPAKVTWHHSTMDAPELREVSVRGPDFPWRPRIEEMTPLILQKDIPTTVSCRIPAYFPKDLTVTWLEKKRQSETDCASKGWLYRIIPIIPIKQADNSWTCSPALSFTPTSDCEDLEYICRVEHLSLESPIERSTGPVRVNVPPQVGDGMRFTLCAPDRVQCSWSLVKFYPQNINITWTRGGQTIASTKKVTQTNDEKTFDAISECTLPWDYFRSRLRVTWSHESLTGQQWRDVSIADFPWRPVIEDVEKPPLLVNTEVRLQYRISGYFPRDLTVTWYKKELGGRNPVLDGNTSVTNGQRQPDNTYSCTACLLFSPLLIEHDGSEFICKVQHPSLAQPLETSTGALHVLMKPKLPQPVQLSISEAGELVGSLTLESFYPKDIRVTWSCGHTKKMQSAETFSVNPDGTFTVTTTCIIPATGTPAIVTWHHSTMDAPELREVSVRGPDFPWRPRIEEMTPLILQEDIPTTVSCRISAYFPKDLTVTWLEKKRQSETDCASKGWLYTIPPIKPEKQADNSWTCSPALSFSPKAVCEDLEYICRVEHPSLESPIEWSTGPARINVPPQEGDGMRFTLCAPDRVQCSWSLVKFYPQNINITWTRGGQTITSTKKVTQTNDEKTFDAISECTLPWDYFRSPVRVTWSHESLAGQQWRDVSEADFPWRPVIEDVEKPPLLVNTEVRLQYRISGYFPRDLTVTWYKKELGGRNPVLDGNTSVTNGQRQPDNTYSCTACLLFSPLLIEHDGSEFICKVQHPSLAQPLETSTGALHVLNFPWRPVIEDVEKPPLLVNTEVRLQYRISGYFPRDLTVTWYKKELGGRNPVLDGNTSVTNGQRQPDNTYSCTACLLFSPLLIEHDGSEFICKVQHPSLAQPLETSTGALHVLMAPEVIEPVRFSLCDPGQLLCSLTLRRFYPRAITFTWTHGNQRLSLKPKDSVTESGNGRTFDATSECRLPRDFQYPVCVTWKHESLPQPQRTLLTATDFPWRPQIGDIDAANLIQGSESTLQCKISGYFPDALTVSWYKKDSRGRAFTPLLAGDQYKMSVTPSQRQPDNTYCCTASLVLTPSPGDRGAEILCRVQHPSLGHPIERSSGALQVKEHPTMAPEEIEPVRFSLCDSGQVLCSLTLRRFYPETITFTWTHGDRHPSIKPENSVTESGTGRTFDATSECRLPRDFQYPVCVTWEHASLAQPQRTVLTATDFPWRPHIGDIDASKLIQDIVSELQCKISGYFPDALTVSWHKKDSRGRAFNPLPAGDQYKTSVTPSQRQPDNTYSCTASLVLTPSPGDRGAEILCRVEHPSLGHPIERSSGALQVKEPPTPAAEVNQQHGARVPQKADGSSVDGSGFSSEKAAESKNANQLPHNPAAASEKPHTSNASYGEPKYKAYGSRYPI